MESLSAYMPIDRYLALVASKSLPDRNHGAALFADISGFTPLTEALARELGPQRGAEELTRHLNLVYDALIGELHRYGGSVISFSGDAITCWFEGDSGLFATACALSMQQTMGRFTSVALPSGQTLALAMKVAVSTGPARRFLVGDASIQVIDALAGAILDQLAAAEHLAGKGEIVLDPAAVAALAEQVRVDEWRVDENGQRFGVVRDMVKPIAPLPWAPVRADALRDEQVRPWLLPPVYERLSSGQGEFLAELRPAVALFLLFGGIDYDTDEEAQTKLDSYIRAVQKVVVRYEGSLLQLTIGDKGSYLYVAFGAPLAHEDDIVRAASAALELRSLKGDFPYIHDVRIGISRGRMRTGAYGGAMRRTYGVLGDDVNLAARLMQAAVPGQILASRAAYQGAEAEFEWERLPDIRVKGKVEPVAIFSLIGARERRAVRLQEPEYALPMVGREAELEIGSRKIDQARGGRGQILGITGEAGIGKSRLAAEIIRSAGEKQIVGYGGECLSYGTNTSYLVWHSIWRSFFGVDPAWSLEKQVKMLTRQLRMIDAAFVPRLPLLGAALNLPIPDNDLTQSFDAQLRKTSLESLLVDCVRARARMTPTMFVLEDCHWLDPLSHDLLEAIGRAIADVPVLIVMAYRPPEVQRLQAPRVSQLPHFTEIRLTSFTPQEAEELIRLKLERFFGPHVAAPRDVVDRLVTRAEGNPFYIEELLNYLQDRGIDPQDSRALEQLDLPASLHSLILARIDQVTERQKTTLRVAAVVGRLFRAAMLWGAYPPLGGPQQVKVDLDALSRLELTSLDAEPELTYIFKHIVTQEVAYESLPFATRAMLHGQIAEYIERSHPQAPDQQVDLLAFHYDRSENEPKKREYLLRAGEAAQGRYANAAAIDYYRRVLRLLPAAQQVPVRLKLGQVLEVTGNWDESLDAYRQALELAQGLGDRQAQSRSQAATGELLRKRGRYDEAGQWLAQARAGFEALGDEAGVGLTLHYAGSLAAQQGNTEAARALYGESLAIRRRLDDKPQIANLLSNLGIVARLRGEYASAHALHEEALAIRRELKDRRAVGVSLNNLGFVAQEQGNHAEARARLEEAVALNREVGDKQNTAIALNNLGNVVRSQGDYAAANELYRESVILYRELGDRWALAYALEDAGVLAVMQGRADRALRLVEAALTVRETIGAPRSSVEQEKLARALAPAREALSDAEQEASRAQGRAMSLDQAIEYALSE